ncbi:unnamed protein product [Ostreobium quekettii]|uniref:J domain-containing protein n=1 Tax=Ostreobium quekettii TaxID=121088 RepID=A0A8S1J1S4_9CHLO|nr:unnamed protein product [Ostreobium quekettii]|eukprot:evm.model.scf_1565.8 EVM.evm.TU.scf_1565.8   scf_1565:29425-30794(+)
MTTPILAGLGVASAALAGRAALQAYQSLKSGAGRSLKQFYKGGFLQEMTRREAAQILGLRESAPAERVKDAHRKIMVANHPDAGGSSYIAAKVNEAKDMLIGKKKGRSSAF